MFSKDRTFRNDDSAAAELKKMYGRSSSSSRLDQEWEASAAWLAREPLYAHPCHLWSLANPDREASTTMEQKSRIPYPPTMRITQEQPMYETQYRPEDVAGRLGETKAFTSPQETTQRPTRQDFGSELPSCPPILSCGRPQISLPRLRELDIFSSFRLSASATYWPHTTRSPEGFRVSAAQGPVPLAAYSDQSPPSLSTAARHYWHGPQELTAVRGYGPDRLSGNLQSREPTPRRHHRPRRPSSHPHCNRPYTIEQVDFIAYFRDDLRLLWRTVEEKFAAVFPRDANQGHRRRAAGLQGVYYRHGKQSSERHCRSRGQKTTDLIGLLATHPDQAIKYSWVSHEDRDHCASVVMYSRTSLPLSVCVNLGTHVATEPDHAERAGCNR
ncbi:hypothetical protein BDP55DRAFT_639493 [Colletotrichum godetiae]|uniref:Uncharacterized protein n=1 Tax=Colletotrichum godetiae TaxID=1209918 RepID=A0AAJ0A7T6_9PEZI|nr:uncharacterized protein BDP55DRAFT_639493 [Colletotrichum godetiae]KAK1656602.1 hypothetical protein BDP55DRAFT_639493 [Colletotrichum godetiae]